ncbi:MAG: hypothetical protein JNK87_42705 [Bryobacterales bacterium]|nr:hypothetical protein [Bryobacterales bacterium]
MASISFTVWKMGEQKHGKLVLELSPSRKWQATNCEPWLSACSGSWSRGYLGPPSRGMLRPASFILNDTAGNRVLVLPCWDTLSGQGVVQAGVGGPLGPELILRRLGDVCATRDFEICVAGSLGVSAGVVQLEMTKLAIRESGDDKGTPVKYAYSGFGPSIGLKVPQGAGTAAKAASKWAGRAGQLGATPFQGPWNTFQAPGWMSPYDFEGPAVATAPYNAVGGGVALSWNTLWFGESEDSDYLVKLNNFDTGTTFSLPQAGASKGSMTVIRATPPSRPIK